MGKGSRRVRCPWAPNVLATPLPETPSFPGPNQTGPGVGEHFKENFRVGSGNFISGRSWSGYFLAGNETFSPGISGMNLPFIPKLRK